MLVIPKDHAQYMRELSSNVRGALIDAVVSAKAYLMTADLQSVYENMYQTVSDPRAQQFIGLTLAKLKAISSNPDGFNDGLNDGPAAGQTVPHFHWHVLPRWNGDLPDPVGGIRHMFPGMGNYHKGVTASH